MAEVVKCDARESAVCCCVDVGTIIDNTDCVAKYEKVFATKQEAEQALSQLTEKARSVESEPCKIDSHISTVDKGVNLKASFTFSCEAEMLIFQLGLR